ncbi:Moa, A lectin from the mushroom marasmius Oreades in complex with the trisaccharide Galgalglcnac [Suillus clintonianus]|uniref:Moa, A lectin from the mushroom marasmius Oreades in complex with the trisaccharide Galgalglcnac n=1 Tax=Suillus clintonianus TaxID=1904413 RepID=UPI001B85D00B|nr:Moa, A lectin from the mushroom marasmius Oreades in complex with the trisaccharide Galgalglcnac [Suillus clintonianus]KAG2139287.1 Moa, A lectin from the mushroom marasmius Oreades in complex with the trisaccharide Galgalglcnac [Suillus clintonianus]
MSLRGVYFISSTKNSPMTINLEGGSRTDGAAVNGWQKYPWMAATANFPLSQLWLLQLAKGETDMYTIRNLQGGTYMCLAEGPDNGAPIIGRVPTGAEGNRRFWIIRQKNGSGPYMIQNVHTKTFVDLNRGGTVNGTRIQGWNGEGGQWSYKGANQLWDFERVSRSGPEVHTILKESPNLAQDFASYKVDGEYLILPQALLSEIWKGSTLPGRKWRADIFDCDDFAAVYKGCVATWGDDSIHADGVSLLCGLMLGRSESHSKPGHAYNFTLSNDCLRVLFFEPQDNTFKNDNGYIPYLGYF